MNMCCPTHVPGLLRWRGKLTLLEWQVVHTQTFKKRFVANIAKLPEITR